MAAPKTTAAPGAPARAGRAEQLLAHDRRHGRGGDVAGAAEGDAAEQGEPRPLARRSSVSGLEMGGLVGRCTVIAG